MEFRILGPVELVGADGPVGLGGRQRRLLLAVLVSRPGVVCSADMLADALWGAEPPASATAVLQAQVYRLRKLFEPQRLARVPASVLRSVGDGYLINLDGHSLDAARFTQLADQGRAALAADPALAKTRFGEALAVWRGQPFGDLADQRALEAAAAELAERRLGVTEELAEARLRLGEHAALVAELDTLVSTHPYRERLWAQLMLALYRCGRQADALATYQRCRRQLSDALGIEPSPDLRALEEAILLQKPELDWHRVSAVAPLPSPVLRDRVTLVLAIADGSPDGLDVVQRLAEPHGALIAPTNENDERTLVMFESPTTAMYVASELQRASVGVRLAVDSGDVICLGDDWFGQAVSYVLGLGSLAHPGQVLVSGTTAALVGQDLPEGARLRSLGMHRFPDRTGIERIHQLCQPAKPEEFPPLRTASELTDLPAETTSFVGRRAELQQVAQRLENTRLLTLTGPGGCGKTRLALRAARQARDAFPDGVLFVDLAPIDDPDRLPEVVARSLRVQEERGVVVLDTVVGYFRSRQMLLVLDNCEHLVAAVAEFATAVLHACPDVRVLATSRERLGVSGEASWAVPTLTLPAGDTVDDALASESVLLFRDRARSVAPDFELGPTNVGEVATVCRHLDGLPLAIELAAARARVLSPGEILTRLDDRFALLKTSDRAAPARQRTLRAVVDWSYEQLSEDVRRLLQLLSVFAGGFSLDAAESVGGPDTLDRLTELIDRSLVQVLAGNPARYRLLETIRAYAAELLANRPDAERTARAAHAGYFAALAERGSEHFIGPRFLAWREAFETDHDNLRAAIDWAIEHDIETALRLCGALATPWAEGGHILELESVSSATLDAAPTDSPLRAGALCAVAWMAMTAGDLDRSVSLFEEALEVAHSREDRRTEALALQMLGAAALHQGKTAKAAAYDESLARLPDSWFGLQTIQHARFRWAVGDRDSPHQLLDDGVEMARSSGNQLALIHAARVRATISPVAERDEVIQALREAVDLAAKSGLAGQLIWCLHDLALCLKDQGEFSAAREHLEESLTVATDIAARLHIVETRELLAQLDRLEWRVDSARGHLDVVRQSPDPSHLNRALRLLAELDWLSGNARRAVEAYRAAAEAGNDSERACAVIGSAAVQADIGEPVDGDALRRACDRLLPPLRQDVRAWHLAVAGRLYAATGADAHATSVLRDALDDAELSGNLPVTVQVIEQIAYLAGTHDPNPTAQLLAATMSARARFGMPRAPCEAGWHSEAESSVRASLGPVEWEVAERRGSELDPAQAVGSARALLDSE